MQSWRALAAEGTGKARSVEGRKNEPRGSERGSYAGMCNKETDAGPRRACASQRADAQGPSQETVQELGRAVGV